MTRYRYFERAKFQARPNMTEFTQRSILAPCEVARSPISKRFLQAFPTPGTASHLSLSIPIKVLFEIPGRADTICGKDNTLKLARPNVIELGKIIAGDFKMISQRVANRVP